MAGMTAATKETAALAVTALGSWISLHTADPGTTGTSEATGGAPAYARKQTTWTAGGSDGVVTGSAVVFDVPAGTYAWVGLWSAVTAGTYIGSCAVSSTVLGAQGTITVTPTYTEA